MLDCRIVRHGHEIAFLDRRHRLGALANEVDKPFHESDLLREGELFYIRFNPLES